MDRVVARGVCRAVVVVLWVVFWPVPVGCMIYARVVDPFGMKICD
jgi:hypothetical protein